MCDSPVREWLCEEEVFRQVLAEGLHAAHLVQELLAHQGGHPRRAVDAEQVGRKVDAGVGRPKVHLEHTHNAGFTNMVSYGS